MPPGAREYCQFIFKGAQAILASVKIVDDHVKKIIDATKYLDKYRDVIGNNDINVMSGRQILKMRKGSFSQKLDARWGKPK